MSLAQLQPQLVHLNVECLYEIDAQDTIDLSHFSLLLKMVGWVDGELESKAYLTCQLSRS